MKAIAHANGVLPYHNYASKLGSVSFVGYVRIHIWAGLTGGSFGFGIRSRRG